MAKMAGAQPQIDACEKGDKTYCGKFGGCQGDRDCYEGYMKVLIPEGYDCTYKSDSGKLADSPGCWCQDKPVDRQCDKRWDLIQMRKQYELRSGEIKLI